MFIRFGWRILGILEIQSDDSGISFFSLVLAIGDEDDDFWSFIFEFPQTFEDYC